MRIQNNTTFDGPAARRQVRLAAPCRLAAALLAAVLLFAIATAPSALAGTTRDYEMSFGNFPPEGIAVDQDTGDIYVVDETDSSDKKIRRFDSTGTPKNFTQGPSAGTNELMGFGSILTDIAIDNSGGPLNGTIYAALGDSNLSSDTSIKMFRPTGASAGTLDGSTNSDGEFGVACGLAVDQTNGALYIGQGGGVGGNIGGKIWRYMPTGPAAILTDDNFDVTGIASPSCQLAAHAGEVYSRQLSGGLDGAGFGPVRKFGASEFSTQPVFRSGTAVDDGVHAVTVDSNTGDVYLVKEHHIAVLDAAGNLLYTFGAAAYFGTQGGDIALKEASSGSADNVYVTDFEVGPEIEVFGPVVHLPRFVRPEVAAFGPDGTSGSAFSTAKLSMLAFAQDTNRLFATTADTTEVTTGGLYGFDASTPPLYSPLDDFDPFIIPRPGDEQPGLGVDNTMLSSSGNIYLASTTSDEIYGWDATGTPLGGTFPIDPETTPGAPDGSPAELCGLAVDSEGHIWVANEATQKVLEYSAAGVFLSAIDVSAQGSPCALAFTSNDDLYVGIQGRDVWRYTASSGYAAADLITEGRELRTLTIDLEDDHLYAGFRIWIDEFDENGDFVFEISNLEIVAGLASDGGYLYAGTRDFETGGKIRVYAPSVLLPETGIRSASDLTNTSATLNGVVETQEVVLTDCHFEYVTEDAFVKTGFNDLSSGGSVPCSPAAETIPLDLEFHSVSADISGLSPDVEYRFRLAAENADGSSVSPTEGFTAANPPRVETTGTPIRSGTTAQLLGRVHPSRQPTSFHFEYGSQGPCEANPCASTPDRSVGSDNSYRFVAETIEGLQPNTTYHYRLVADNGNPDGPAIGESMSVTTRPTNAPLTHGDFPGPSGSDRAWEQVSIADSGGNPIALANGFSDSGERAVYGITGGTPIAESGSFLSLYYSERKETSSHSGGWRTSLITPPREELVGPNWTGIMAPDDLSSVIGRNWEIGDVIWKFGPGQDPAKLFQPTPPQELVQFSNGSGGPFFGISGDGTRTIAGLRGGELDPGFPSAASQLNLYDISSGAPELVTPMPGGAPSPCGATGPLTENRAQESHWIAEDGSFLFFQSKGPDCGSTSHLYVRDLEVGETKLVVTDGTFIKLTPAGAFLSTKESLDPDDAGGNDIYLYDPASADMNCVTCVLPGEPTAVTGESPLTVAVSDDGSRLYFGSPKRLLPGVNGGFYRIAVKSGDLANVGAAGGGATAFGVSISSDGRFYSFSSSSPQLNAIGGWNNGSTTQYYLYDDVERWIVCVSCPRDGTAPVDSVPVFSRESGPNLGTLANDGTLAFRTTTALLGADQNTPAGSNLDPGTDVYEWRDGRQLLVTDGLTQWSPQAEPFVWGISPSGRDLFFSAAAQYTADAPDAYMRIYDARIGGGFEFPAPRKPCPLEVCQGSPKGVPEESPPGTGSFVGPGNVKSTSFKPRARCGKGKRKARRAGKVRCVKQKQRSTKRANPNRRATR